MSHAAITENKHLSAVLEYIMAEQDKAPPKTHRVGKQCIRYTPTWRRNNGLNLLPDRKRKGAGAASQRSDA